MRKFFILIVFIFVSCSTDKNLRYRIKNNEVNVVLQNEIELLKKNNFEKEIIIVLGKEELFNKITLQPRNKDKNVFRIQNLPIKKTNRYMLINKKKYFVVFDYDYDFGIVEDYKVNDGVTDTIYRQDVYIIEHSVTFLFDKDWNFIKKE
jgi:hypothetical protein